MVNRSPDRTKIAFKIGCFAEMVGADAGKTG
jgi:hypothetical protein